MMIAHDRTMVPLERACALLDELSEGFYASLPVEEISIEAAVGRKLAEDAVAAASMPPYDTCTMDGYAVRSADGYPLRIVGEAYAGRDFGRIGPREAVYVTTGARLPGGADAVLPVEEARLVGVALTGPILAPGKFVVRSGADFAAGTVVLPKGSLVVPAMAGVLRTAGIRRIAVYRKPRVAVLATGDEIRDGTVADANGPMVCALLEAWGCAPERVCPVGDDREKLAEIIASCVARYDVIVTIGGVSAGKKDLVRGVVEGGQVVFRGVRVKPGMPFIATLSGSVPVFSLPGKPSGSYTAMELFVRRFLLGEARRRTVDLPVSRDVELQAPGFDYVVFVELLGGRAQPVGYEGSSLKLFAGPEYSTSLLSTSARTALSDGYFIARDPVKAGQPVTVNLN